MRVRRLASRFKGLRGTDRLASAISASSSYFFAGGGARGTCVSTLSLESSSEPSWEPPLLPLLLLDSPLLSELLPPESPELLETACLTSDHSWGGQFASLLGEDEDEGGDASRFCSQPEACASHCACLGLSGPSASNDLKSTSSADVMPSKSFAA